MQFGGAERGSLVPQRLKPEILAALPQISTPSNQQRVCRRPRHKCLLHPGDADSLFGIRAFRRKSLIRDSEWESRPLLRKGTGHPIIYLKDRYIKGWLAAGCIESFYASEPQL